MNTILWDLAAEEQTQIFFEKVMHAASCGKFTADY